MTKIFTKNVGNESGAKDAWSSLRDANKSCRLDL